MLKKKWFRHLVMAAGLVLGLYSASIARQQLKDKQKASAKKNS